MAEALPNLIVIGAMKCGTSSLHYYLDLHPEVQMSRPKELNFFLAEEGFDPQPFVSDPRQLPRLGRPNWSRGLDWYAGHFSSEAPVRGETSVAYTYPWYRDVAARIARVVPDAKLIFVVRDPVERMISHYLQFSGRESRSLDEALGDLRSPYFALSRYASALQPFLDRFPRSRIHLARQEELLHKRRQAMRDIFGFLRVDDSFWSERMQRVRNLSAGQGRGFRAAARLRLSRGGAPLRSLPPGARWAIERLVSRRARVMERPRLDPAVRGRVIDALEPEIARLESLTGWNLSEWRLRPAVLEGRSG